MSDSLNRLKRKRANRITVGDDVFFVRTLTIGELKQMDGISGDDKTAYVVACALVNEDGSQVIKRNEGESSTDYAKRALIELEDVETATIKALTDGVAAIGKPANAEAVVKN